MQKLGVCKKDTCYKMGTEVFKIKEEMTEKMKPKVGNPPLKIGGIPCSQYFLSHFFFNFAFWMSLVVVMAIFQTLDTL